MNYRHIYHAGNFADVFKHVALLLILEHLRLKEKPFFVLDTHAGIGLYDLQSEQARKTNEAAGGVQWLWERRGAAPETVGRYLDLVGSFNRKGELRIYPGSPMIAQALLRSGDRLIANELHPEDNAALLGNLGGDALCRVEKEDGYQTLKAFLPPPERRGVVVIDPPFEVMDEFDRLVAGFDVAEVTPLVRLSEDLWMLELWHGPTAAFKDLAMQLAAALSEEALAASGERLTLVTATSGDTGAAAVNAFAGKDRIDLIVLHPLDRVSAVQRRQMTTVEADNVLNLAIRGDFDDCQRLVKGLLAEESLRDRGRFSSVNSINWARLAGQIPYYVSASMQLAAAGESRSPTFVVPTGNFGDAFAGIAARRMGLPVAGFVAAVNRNDALARAINDGVYARRAAVETASVSMDVQAPSNFERLVFEASGRDAAATAAVFEAFARDGSVALPANVLAAIRAEVTAISIDEETTRAEIAHAYEAYGRVVCPHTAVALAASRRQLAQNGGGSGPVVALSTAHAAKFGKDVAPVLGFDPDPPRVIRDLGDRAERLTVIEATPEAALDAVRGFRR